MILGNPARFAIEIELNKNHYDRWLFGKFGYWIYNVRIGNYDEGVSLRDVLVCMPWLVGDNGNRKDSELFALETNKLFRTIDNALYGEGDLTEKTWARFEIKLLIDIFNEWKIYLIENVESARMITEHHGNISEFRLNPKEFDDVLHAAYNKLYELYENEDE